MSYVCSFPLQPKMAGSRDLLGAWYALQQQDASALSLHDAARQLGVTEAQLLLARRDEGVIPLQPDWATLLPALESLGPVVGVTRNAHAIHERTGVYGNVRFMGGGARLESADISLHLTLSHWHHAMAVVEESVGETCRSLAFFDRSGAAVHTIHLSADSDVKAFERMVSRHRLGMESWRFSPSLFQEPDHPVSQGIPRVDITTLRDGWDNLLDSHDFEALLRQCGLSRLNALRLAGRERAFPVARDNGFTILEYVRDDALQVMVSVANPATVQVHAGLLNRCFQGDGWWRVLDPRFRLHLCQSGISEVWVVCRPSRQGTTHSLEWYSRDGQLVMQLLGKSGRGQPDDPLWRNLMGSLDRL
ncbi:ChuX/HutX family heme-like substrate-binding protein [Ectothiorhodospira shaposhnikovii]|uniref:ChuX/HutX family heme-like substrate-binding protein n=1 Tax=Ectothiorhodospira shaposhnikovii TaxID=1054 RepID=UPI001906A03C|nr:ChuX/HutX family heme-like substrate-binding protein [Ectothiorhodospira shaposhnikovii]